MKETFAEGDLVEATNPEGGTLTGRLGRRHDGGLYLGCYNWSFPHWVVQNAGFSTIRTIEKAAPALPTAEGAYVDKYGYDVWTITSSHGLRCVASGSSNPAKYAPFTRLEPVADTAKQVLDDVAAYWEFGTPANVSIALTSAAKNFGVVYE